MSMWDAMRPEMIEVCSNPVHEDQVEEALKSIRKAVSLKHAPKRVREAASDIWAEDLPLYDLPTFLRDAMYVSGWLIFHELRWRIL